jgi:hypothetical protein
MTVLFHRYGFWVSVICSIVVSTLICSASSTYTRRDPKFFSVRFRAFFHAAVYDPAKCKPFHLEVKR